MNIQKRISLQIMSGELLSLMNAINSMKGFCCIHAKKDAQTIADDVIVGNFLEGALSLLEESLGIDALEKLSRELGYIE